MRILFDHQTFSIQKYGGISQYIVELVNGLNDNIEHQAFISSLISNNENLAKLTDFETHTFLSNFDFKGKKRIIEYLNEVYSKKIIRSNNFDIFHPTYYNPYFLDFIGSKPFVVTFHDLIHEKFITKFPALQRDGKIMSGKKELAFKAKKIIAVSKNTKQDLVELFKIEEDKIEVIHLASTLKITKKNISSKLVDQPYLLFVGNRGLYKNFDLFLDSVADILHTNSDLLLVCVGGGKFEAKEYDHINRLGLSNKVIYLQVGNEDRLANLYHYAEIFVFPTLYEGFGIPIVEAMNCICPCALSNSGSLPEIAGEAAIYFNPLDPSSINKAISNLLFDSNLKNELKQKGIARARLFEWEKTVKETIRVYESCTL